MEPGQLVHRQPAARPAEDRRQPRDVDQLLPERAVRATTTPASASMPQGGLDQQAGLSQRLGTSFGSYQQGLNIRAAAHGQRGRELLHDVGAVARLQVRRRLAAQRRVHRHALARQQDPRASRTRRRARSRACIVKAPARTASSSSTSMSATRSRRTAVTIDLGVRYDRQWGKALPSQIASNAGVPERRAGHRTSRATTRRSPGTTSRRASA